MATMALTQVENPYVGPRTFRTDERAKFFGRDREARELTSLVIANRLILFYAPSGAGKSSLLNTMISPMLEEAGFEMLPTGRVSGHSGKEVPEAENIYVYNLLLSLQKTEELTADFSQLTIAQFLDNLVEHEDGSYFYDPAYEYPPNMEFKPRVLILDQFEELVTTNNAYWTQRAAFFRQLTAAVEQDDQLWVVLTMRDDYVTRFDSYLHLTPNQLRHRYHMDRLTRKEAQSAIESPVANIRRFMPGAIELLLDNLLRIPAAEEQADGAAEEQFAQFVEPVQLQTVCYQMWEKLVEQPGKAITTAHVKRYADVDTALTDFYEDIVVQTMWSHSVSEIVLRDWFEKKLITEAGTRNMVYKGEDETGGLPTEIAEAILQRFILREEVRPGGVWYEIVHDRFVPPILASNQAWRLKQPLPRLTAQWVAGGRSRELLLDKQGLNRLTADEDWRLMGEEVVAFVEASQALQQEEKMQAEQLAFQHQQELAKAERQRADEAEAAKKKREKLIGAVALVAVLAIVLAIWGVIQRNQAVEQSAIAKFNEVLAGTRAAEAATSEATAVASAKQAATEQARAVTAEAQANEEKNIAATQEARASANAEEAKQAQAEAESLRLAYPARDFLGQGRNNIVGALLVGVEIYKASELIAERVDPQVRLGSMWLALNQAADIQLNQQSFRQSWPMPVGLPITHTVLMAGSAPDRVALLLGNQIVEWGIHDELAASSSYSLPLVVKQAVFVGAGELVAADESAVYLLQRAEGHFVVQEEWPVVDNYHITTIALSPDGQQIAVASCPLPNKSGDSNQGSSEGIAPDTTSTLSEEQKTTPTPTLSPTTPTCSIHFLEGSTWEANLGKQINNLPITNSPIALAFDGNERIIWVDTNTIRSHSFANTDELPSIMLPPLERDHRYQTVAIVGQENEWLVVGGCLSQAENKCDAGFTRWWHLHRGGWLSEDTTRPFTITNLLYMAKPERLVSLDSDGEIQAWSTDMANWPELSCAIAGRNMTIHEWREVFGNKEPVPTCTNGVLLDIQFAYQELLKCEDSDPASTLYHQATPPQFKGEPLSFAEWAIPILFNDIATNSADPVRVEQCVAVAQSLYPAAESFPAIDREQLADLQQAIGGAALEEIEQLEASEPFTRLSQEHALAPIAQTYLAALYGERCAFRLTVRTEEQACRRYDELLAQHAAEAVNAPFVPVLAERRQGLWAFIGRGGDFVTLSLPPTTSGGIPSLTLRNIEGRTLETSVSNRDGYALLQLSLPQDGVYYLQANDSLGITHPIMPQMGQAQRPPTLTAERVTVNDSYALWQVGGQKEQLITLHIEPSYPERYGRLVVRNSQWQVIFQNENPARSLSNLPIWLPEEGDYFVSLLWYDNLAEPFEMALNVIEPILLEEGEVVEATAEQVFWQVTGEQGNMVAITVTAEDDFRNGQLVIWDAQNNVVTWRTGSTAELTNINLFLTQEEPYLVRMRWNDDREAGYAIGQTAVDIPILNTDTTILGEPDQGWWQFTGNAGQSVTIAMDAQGYDPFLRLFDSNQGLLAYNDDWGNSTNSLIQFELPQDGLYYIETSWFNASNPGPYELTRTMTAPSEPIEALDTAVQEALPVVELAHKLTIGAEVEISPNQSRWQFPGEYKQIVEFTTEFDGYLVDLKVTDQNGRTVPLYYPLDYASNGKIYLWLPQLGTYYVQTIWYQDPTTPYFLRLETLDQKQDPQTASQAEQAGLAYMLAYRSPEGVSDFWERVYASQDAETRKQAALMFIRQIRPEIVERGIPLLVDVQELLTEWEYHDVCLYGQSVGWAAKVMFACQAAVAQSPDNPTFVDTRGRARAQIGDFAGAIADFQSSINSGWNRPERQQWIELLSQGINPFEAISAE